MRPAVSSVRRQLDSLETADGKTSTQLLADLEHVVRVPRHSVRLGAADGEHERHLPVPRGAGERDPDPVAGGAADRPHRAADRRLLLGPHLEPARPPPPLLPRRRDRGEPRPPRHAELERPLDGRGPPVGPRRLRQREHGALPRLRRRHAAARPEEERLRHAEPAHRRRRGPLLGPALRPDPRLRHQRRVHGRERDPAHRPRGVHDRGLRLLPRRAVHGPHDTRVPARGRGGVREGEAGDRRPLSRLPRDLPGHRLHARGHAQAGGRAVLHVVRALLPVDLLRPRRREGDLQGRAPGRIERDRGPGARRPRRTRPFSTRRRVPRARTRSSSGRWRPPCRRARPGAVPWTA